MELNELIGSIGELDAQAMAAAGDRQNQLTKPPGSLGVLEQISIRLAGIQSSVYPDVKNKTVIVMAADHGVTEESVSAYPSEVTAQMVYNFSRGGAAINVLARDQGANVIIVDIGVKEAIDVPGVVGMKIRPGTANMTKGPAMTRAEAERAVLVGVDMAFKAVSEGATLVATGEMGIGNTTAASAIVSVLAGLETGAAVGYGTGVDSAGRARKIAAIDRAIAVNQPDPSDVIDVLAKVGGLEIAGLAGVMLGCAAKRTPVVIDGFISGAAALAASVLAPLSTNYMFASHLSVEPGHALVMSEIGLTPVLRMDMRLGEGTGAVLTMDIIEAAAKIIKEMATFEQAGVTDKEATRVEETI